MRNLKKYNGQLVNAEGVIKAISYKKGSLSGEKTMLLRDVVISNKHGSVKIDHMWLDYPKRADIKINMLFSGIGHIGKYHKKSKTKYKYDTLDYCLVLH